MYSIYTLTQYISYLFREIRLLKPLTNGYDIKNLLHLSNDDKIVATSAIKRLDLVRSKLLLNKGEISVTDLGAGTSKRIKKVRKISDIAKNSSRPRKYNRIIFNIVKQIKPSMILELGTSFGFSSSLFSMAVPEANIITIEGCNNTADIAEKTFKHLNIKNVKLIRGNFDDVLENIQIKEQQIDFAFIDGNHRKDPVIKYFYKILPKMKNDSIMILDDIHWSKEMTEAWKYIIADKAINSYIDCFNIGIVKIKQ